MLESKWWEGPLWLKSSEDWPAKELTCEPREVISETRKSELVNVNVFEESIPWYAVRFSNYHSIVRLMGWILRFINNSRTTVEKRKHFELSSHEIKSAEKVLIRIVQGKMFPNLSSIPLVNAFKDNEGVIRIKTKLTERKDDPNFIAPILLPSNCILTTRLIEYYHHKHCHAGVQILMSILREKFWILKSRKTVRDVVRWCVRCRQYISKSPVSDPVSLPSDRVKDANVFDVTGIDLAGPLFTRDGEDSNDLIPLTPSLFLNGQSSYQTIDLDLSEFSKFQKRIRYRRKLIEDFRSRFRKEYLGQLRQKLPGRDGKVRTLKIRCKNSEIIRPIQRVYPLEVPIESNENVKFDGVAASSSSKVNDIITHNEVIKTKLVGQVD
ncbi:integrase catalytic domain-containing protein [Trichonephila inaurata madagascariensis]|uniref:Integrase catalytic domain-containing protein n=1 Tax=Trichonephila inaurata madagascariensis TaxID=2747483 RepID=A0A8X6Y150_9ARAC|nr:integrase catalytic domain-containing protein [Trichonephila inaurata madagascariensis]